MTTLPFETETPDEEFRLWTAMPLGHQGAGAVSLGERDLEWKVNPPWNQI